MGLNIVKDFLVMSLKHKTENVNWEGLGTNASFLPVIYLIVMAPGLLVLLGLCCVVATGVSTFYANPGFPQEFFLALGGSLIVLGLVLIISYRIIIKYQFKLKRSRAPEEEHAAVVLKSPLEEALAPFLKQLMAEQRLFLNKK